MSIESATDGEEASRAIEARLTELDERFQAYKKLDSTLEKLPRRTQWNALVPLGPRLYARGKLVHTNEVFVLLGRSGNETFFAERSAYQARKMVGRRFDALFSARENAISQYQTHVTATACAARMVKSSGSDGRDPRKEETAVSEPVIQRKGSILRTPGSSSHLSEKKSTTKKKVHFADEDIRGKANCEEVPTTTFDRSSNQGIGGEAQPDSATTLKKEISEAIHGAKQCMVDDDVVFLTEVYKSKDDDVPTFVDMPSHFRPDERVSFADDSEEFLDISGPSRQSIPQIQGMPEESTTTSGKTEQCPSIDSSEETVSEDNKPTSSEDRELIFQELLESERIFEEEERRSESEKKRNALEKETNEFGSGFARGFFSTSKASKPLKSLPQAHSGTIDQNEQLNSNTTIMGVEAPFTEGASVIKSSDTLRAPSGAESGQPMTTEDSAEQVGPPVVQDVILERKSAGGRRRKGQRYRAKVHKTAGPRSPTVALASDNVGDLLEIGHSGINDDIMLEEHDEEARPISKFKQMRQLQRGKLSSP